MIDRSHILSENADAFVHIRDDGVADREDDKVTVTLSGYLVFAREQQKRIASIYGQTYDMAQEAINKINSTGQTISFDRYIWMYEILWK